MDNITGFRQEEALRLMEWIVEEQKEWGNIDGIIRENISNTDRILTAIKDIKKREFYFFLPLILQIGTLDRRSSLALEKMQFRHFVSLMKLSSLDAVCARIIEAIEAEL